MDYDAAYKKLEKMNDLKSASRDRFIDRVITVTTGALAFSITFRSSIIGTDAQYIWLLQVAWICLAVSAVSGVFLHRAGASAAMRMVEAMKNNPDHRCAGAHPIYNFLNFLIVTCFPSGLTAFMLFAVLNTTQ